jgi:hypothetical protein
VSPQVLIAFLIAIVCSLAACTAVCWAVHQTGKRRSAETQRRQAEARLNTYRQWADGHIYLAFPEPHDLEGGDTRA